MSLATFKDLYVDQLKDLYDAENQLLAALPKMATAAMNPDLKECFNSHLQETQGHVRRLERVFSDLGQKPMRKHCKAMEGLITEGEEIVMQSGDGDVKDAALIAAAQRVEHYEMAGYGVARTFARQLDLGTEADLLQETLDEEGAADKKLTRIAQGGLLTTGVNKEAARH